MPVLDRPLDRPLEHRLVVAVHAEDEAAVDHHAAGRAGDGSPARSRGAGSDTCRCSTRFVGVERFEPDEEAAQARVHGLLEQTGREHGVDRAGGLPETAHAAHAVEQRRGEAAVAEQVIVEKVEMTAGQPLDLGERRVDGLRVERLARPRRTPPCSRSRRRAGSRATRRSSSGTRYSRRLIRSRRIGGKPVERPESRLIDARRQPRAEVGEEPRPRVFAGTEEDRVGVRRALPSGSDVTCRPPSATCAPARR